MIDLLILLLKPALLCVDGGSRRPHHIVAVLIAWPLDMLIAHTAWALIAGWPQRGEWTISQTLERLCSPINAGHPRWRLFFEIAREINRASPNGNHIKIIQKAN